MERREPLKGWSWYLLSTRRITFIAAGRADGRAAAGAAAQEGHSELPTQSTQGVLPASLSHVVTISTQFKCMLKVCSYLAFLTSCLHILVSYLPLSCMSSGGTSMTERGSQVDRVPPVLTGDASPPSEAGLGSMRLLMTPIV